MRRDDEQPMLSFVPGEFTLDEHQADFMDAVHATALALEDSEVRRRGVEGALTRVQKEATIFRDERDAARKRVDVLTRQLATVTQQRDKAASQQLDVKIARLRGKLKRSRKALRRSRQRERALRRSRSFRLGEMLLVILRPGTKVSFRVRRLMLLPRDIIRLWRTAPVAVPPPLKRKKVRQPIAPVAAKEEIAAPVVPDGPEIELTTTYERHVGGAGGASTVRDDRAEAARRRLQASYTDVRSLRIAAVVDDFTRKALSMECKLQDLHPDSWRTEMESFEPDILFVESAWRGEAGTWHNTVPRYVEELAQIVDYCRERGIPTVFWNKEDPVHFQTFLRTAREFDYVFTTDADCIAGYRAALGHKRVHFLGFAAQPKIHHPIESRPRQDAMVFAGGYYQRYPERMRDLDSIIGAVREVLPIEIWDRSYGTVLEDYRFPDSFQDMIVGTLDPADVHIAYKGYKFALNLNSVKHSQTMFARRAYELLSCGTVTVSNYAKGLSVLLGGLVPASDHGDDLARVIHELDTNPVAYDRLKLMGMRKVHTEHTYNERLRYVLSCILGDEYETQRPSILVVSAVADQRAAAQVIDAVERQVGVTARLVLVSDDAGARTAAQDAGHVVVDTATAHEHQLSQYLNQSVGCALFDPEDWYGANYLQDLVSAWTYADADVVGKAVFARADNGAWDLASEGVAYSYVPAVERRRSLVASHACADVTVDDFVMGLPIADVRSLSVDRFDYCEGGAHLETAALVHLRGSDETGSGTDLATLLARIDQVVAESTDDHQHLVVSADVLAAAPDSAAVAIRRMGSSVRITSELAAGNFEYHWMSKEIPLPESWKSGEGFLSVLAEGNLDLQIGLRLLDEQGNRLEFTSWPVVKVNRDNVVNVPPEAVALSLGYRVSGSGISTVEVVALEATRQEPLVVGSESEVLVLADHYPSHEDLYRNGFVHARVKAYEQEGLSADVFRFTGESVLSHHEFEGIEVASGGVNALRAVLEAGKYRAVAVHFLSPAMWEVLRDLRASTRVVVWIHGAEVQPWWRRSFNYSTDDELAKAKAASDRRLEFWREVFTADRSNLHFVFVSQYFAEEVLEDVEVALLPERYSIVHNPIDTDLFSYRKKLPDQRLKLLSIRPFTSAKYANDLTVEAIALLA